MFNTFFKPMDPEKAHHLVYTALATAGRCPGLRDVVQGALAPYLGRGAGGPGSVHILGRTFPARFGLAGGFDKDAGCVAGLTMLGFGYIEIGTVTPLPQPGNDKPRMWREVDMDSVRNQMGFNNIGADAVAQKLRQLRSTRHGSAAVIGVNIGKNKLTDAAHAAQDYAICAQKLAPYADYLVVNVSSPNTPGLRDLQSIDSLRPILEAARQGADAGTDGTGTGGAAGRRVPLLVKIAPDLANEDVVAVAQLVEDMNLDGVVAVNTTINHQLGPGGFSGPPLKERGLEVVSLLRSTLSTHRVIIGCGGISTPDDARDYLDAGADLLQGYTGFIYQGPLWPSRINKALARDAAHVG